MAHPLPQSLIGKGDASQHSGSQGTVLGQATAIFGPGEFIHGFESKNKDLRLLKDTDSGDAARTFLR
jgi:hypothetical protein